MIKNEWDVIQDGILTQETELDGMDVEVSFSRVDDGRWELRVWPHVPHGASNIPLPEDLAPLVGKRARVGNTYGGDIGNPNILIESCMISSLYAQFDAEKAAEIVASARVKEDEDEPE